MRDTPGSSTTATRFLSDSQSHTLVERATVKCHLSGIRATRYANTLGVDLSHLRSQQLQAVYQSAKAPSPFAIGAIILQMGIETVEVMLSPLVMLTPLTVVVHLLLVEVHGGNWSVGKQLTWQRNHARSYHQCIGCLTRLRIFNLRTQGQRFTIHRHIHNQRITAHTGLDILFLDYGFLADTVMLNQRSNLTATARPVAKTLYTFQCIGQVLDNGQLAGLGHSGLSKVGTRILYLIEQRKLATLLRLSTEGSTTQYNS